MKCTFTCKKVSLNDSIKEYAEKKILGLNADYVLFGETVAPIQRIADLLRDQDEKTARLAEQVVAALLQALDEQESS